MSLTRIRLKQELRFLSEGIQLTQWIATKPPGVTDPTSVEAAFVVRQVAGIESFEAAARMSDFGSLQANVSRWFEGRREGGDALVGAIPGDILRFTPTPAFWIQQDPPYDTGNFTVDQVEARAAGAAPKVFVGGYIQLPGYSFTNDDLGRWVTLAGFATAGYNRSVRILSINGETAGVDLTISTNETGTSWTFFNVRIVSDVGPALEARVFPSLVINQPWEIVRGVIVIASGPGGYNRRQNPALARYRVTRFVTLEPTIEAAQARVEVTQRGIGLLQHDQEVAAPLLTPGIITTDFPPL